MPATVSLIEVLWTLMGAVTFYVCVQALRRALIARRVVQESPDVGPYEKAALLLAVMTRIVVESLFCYIQVGFMLIGFYSMTRPPTNADPDQHQWGSILITVVFVTIELGCLFVSVWVERLRGRLIEMENTRLGGVVPVTAEPAPWDGETTRPL